MPSVSVVTSKVRPSCVSCDRLTMWKRYGAPLAARAFASNAASSGTGVAVGDGDAANNAPLKKTAASTLAKRMRVGFELVDGYLLGDPVSKPEAVAQILKERIDSPAAAPFYRAFEAIGTRAADEAFIALRLVSAGRIPDDTAVRRLRALSGLARAGRAGDRKRVAALLKREGAVLGDFSPPRNDSPEAYGRLNEAARAAYRAMLV
jgi:transposase